LQQGQLHSCKISFNMADIWMRQLVATEMEMLLHLDLVQPHQALDQAPPRLIQQIIHLHSPHQANQAAAHLETVAA